MSPTDLARFGRWLSSMDPIGYDFRSSSVVCLQLDPSDLYFSSSVMVAVLVRWSHGDLPRRLPDCILQHILPSSSDGGVMTAARFRLALVIVVITRWSTFLDVIFVTSCVLCTVLTVDE